MEQSNESPRATYDALFQHPIARNLAWRDVRSMLVAMVGVVREEHGGTLRVMRAGHELVLHRPDRKNMTDVRELMDVRRFLEASSTGPEQFSLLGTNSLVRIEPAPTVDAAQQASAVEDESPDSIGRAGKGAPTGFGRSRN